MVRIVVKCRTHVSSEGRLPPALPEYSLGVGNVLFLSLGHLHMGVYMCKNSLNCTLTMCALYVFIP